MLTHYGKRKEPARDLRRRQTDAEEELWLYLRTRQFGKYKFRRQVPIGPFFADFCCLKKQIVVEVDGEYHAWNRENDANRTYYFAEKGFRVLRFWNQEVLEDAEEVCRRIKKEIEMFST